MSGSNRSAPKRLLLEGLVVVASILLAFALDAWWDDIAIQRDLRKDIEFVVLEIEANRDRILFHIDLMERMTVAGDSLFAAMESVPEDSLISVPDTIIWLMNNYPTLNPSLGAVEALITSGRLALIEDPALRTALAGLRDRITDAVEEQDKALTLYYDHVLPIVASESRWPQADRTEDYNREFWTLDRVPGRQLPSLGSIAVPVRRDWKRFQSERMGQYRISVGEMQLLLAQLDTLRSMIERQNRRDTGRSAL